MSHLATTTIEHHASPSLELSGVALHPLEATGGLVHVARPLGPAPDLSAWFRRHRVELEARDLAKALLFRGFGFGDRRGFRRVLEALLTPSSYVYRSTPRTEVGDRVYTTTEYPASRSIPLHCENAYQDSWPTRLMFYCDRAPDVGGETPLADVRAITRAIPAQIKAEFRQRKLRYVRHYHVGVDLSWQTVFQARTPAEVEAYCDAHRIRYRWLDEGVLRTEQVCDAMIRHPRTGEQLWFNQAHLFHVSNLDAATRTALLSLYGVDALPRHVSFADGGSIDEGAMAAIRAVFAAHARAFAWQTGDLLHLDNLCVAHGRNPYEGERSVLVGMGDPRTGPAL